MSVNLSVHVPNGCALVIVCPCALWEHPCIVCVPLQSTHGLAWCGCACVLCGPLWDADVPVPQVFLYMSVPGWVLGRWLSSSEALSPLA